MAPIAPEGSLRPAPHDVLDLSACKNDYEALWGVHDELDAVRAFCGKVLIWLGLTGMTADVHLSWLDPFDGPTQRSR